MNSRLLLASIALHTGLIAGVVAWGAGGGRDERPEPALVAFRPSEPAVPFAETAAPEPEIEVRPEPEPEPQDLPEPVPTPFEPPPEDDLGPAPVDHRTMPPLPADPSVRLRPEPPAIEPVEPTEHRPEAPPPEAVPQEPAFVEARALDGRNDKPDYPREALRRGWSGTVGLRLSIDELGRVVDVQIVAPSRFATLNRAAARAARDWVFEPARRDGVSVASEKDLPVEFQLLDRR